MRCTSSDTKPQQSAAVHAHAQATSTRPQQLAHAQVSAAELHAMNNPQQLTSGTLVSRQMQMSARANVNSHTAGSQQSQESSKRRDSSMLQQYKGNV